MGHRGAAGLALENSATALKKAIELNVDVIEIDVRKTHDNQLILCHDDNFGRVGKPGLKISEHTLAELQKVRLNNGEKPLSLPQALNILKDKPVMIELKDSGTARILVDTLNNFPQSKASICSFNFGELAFVRDFDPNLQLFGLERTRPLEIVQLTNIFDLDGIGIIYWLLNPFLYFWARRRNLQIYVFTVNKPLLVWFIRLLYPGVTICTDFPDKFLHYRHSKKHPKVSS